MLGLLRLFRRFLFCRFQLCCLLFGRFLLCRFSCLFRFCLNGSLLLAVLFLLGFARTAATALLRHSGRLGRFLSLCRFLRLGRLLLLSNDRLHSGLCRGFNRLYSFCSGFRLCFRSFCGSQCSFFHSRGLGLSLLLLRLVLHLGRIRDDDTFRRLLFLHVAPAVKRLLDGSGKQDMHIQRARGMIHEELNRGHIAVVHARDAELSLALASDQEAQQRDDLEIHRVVAGMQQVDILHCRLGTVHSLNR